ncbi:hypothetical protein [Hymenobacter canadensis]|uniref:STAS/SEC14 domain-containing protein n=1 Tax=Hymenobacter canadensis TaxID=2999067 RepID=A0ABY7LJR7_9BACT|nr:hypothetical protein [Hymenobacter canadensis]WBA40685.1 hypothetical protein O3303_12725 [Hymenobacter canadensis]
MMIMENPMLRVQHDAPTGLLRVAWRAGQQVQGFRPALEWLMAFSRRKHVTNWLVDMLGVPPLGYPEQTWIAQEWFAAMATTPVQHLALVLPTDLHNYLVATAPVHEQALKPPFALHFFLDAESAFNWLLGETPHRQQLWQEWQQQPARFAASVLRVL